MTAAGEVRSILALGAALVSSVLVFFALRGWRIERASTRRLGDYAAGQQGGALDRLGESILDRWGVSLGALRLQYRWARLGGYYQNESLAGIVGKAAAYVIIAVVLSLMMAVPLLPALVLVYAGALPLVTLRQRAREVKAEVRRGLPEVAALLAAEMSAGVAPENALRRVAQLPFRVGRIFQEVIDEASRTNRVLFSRGATTGLLKVRLAEWGLDELSAFGAQVDLAATKGTDAPRQMFAVAQGFSREYRAKIQREAEQLSNKLIAPLTIFFFVPMLAAVLLPLMMALGATMGGGF